MRYVPGIIKKDFQKRITAFEKASVAALNKVNGKVFTQVKRGISKDTGVPQKEFAGTGSRKQMLFKRGANASKPVAVIFARGRRIPIGRMKARARKGGVTFLNRGGKRTLIPGAFLIKRQGGDIVFKRAKGAAKVIPSGAGSYRVKGRSYKERKIKRQPIIKLKGPSIARVMARSFMAKIIVETINTQWPVEYERAINRQLRRLGK